MTEENVELEINESPVIVGYSVDCSTGISTPIYDSPEHQANLLELEQQRDLIRQQEQDRIDAKAALVAATGLTEEQINLLF